ncbi:response regulator [Paraglaciecola aquimarina]|uniref:Response regulator n=1 Tax=Paraglaciecola aquimarina TaxID=1235557 RepID=A0ABU3STJ1_9ALTE|nr:response regulator [Paraglaciecola aquimarina]MDU0353329.1 response regulator [Paraglaciecola aquimarina]
MDSRKNEGSTFTAVMRLELNKKVLIESDKTSGKLDNIDVLVVDDNPIALKILTNFLRNIGVRPIPVQSALDGLEVLTNNEYDIKLIVSDWTMPVMDGATFIEEVRKLALNTQPKVIIVSAYEISTFKSESDQLHISHVLSKPCHAGTLYKAMEECLNAKAPKKQVITPINRLANVDILVVEDNEINQVVIEHLLTDEGAKVSIANHGKEAIDLLNEFNTFQIILMDIHMPIMDGIEATRIIRAHPNPKISHIPIVALSANVLEKDVQSYLTIGMNAHGAKPVNIESLIQIILPLLNND